jgi:hypothetical protein
MFNLGQKIRDLVSQNELNKALDELENLSDMISNIQKSDIAIIRSRLTELKSKNIKGLLDTKEEQLELNKIRYAILQIAESLDQLKTIEERRHIILEADEAQPKKDKLLSTLAYIKKVVQYVSFELIGAVLSWAFPLIFIGLIGCFVYFGIFKKGLDGELSFNREKFQYYLNNKQFNRAKRHLDTIPFFFGKDFHYQDICNKQIDFYLFEGKCDSALTCLRSYNFEFQFHSKSQTTSERTTYNSETIRYNDKLELILAEMQKQQQNSKILPTIENYYRFLLKAKNNDDYENERDSAKYKEFIGRFLK